MEQLLPSAGSHREDGDFGIRAEKLQIGNHIEPGSFVSKELEQNSCPAGET
jgi:hypothetical protein